MREIKFKAWHIPTKRWINVFRIDQQGHILLNGSYWHYIASVDYILMQYTGLRDKNGKEIYEGDILQIWDENYEVKITNTESKSFVDYGYPDKHNGPAPDWVKVIGNIYETPELLDNLTK